MSVMMHCGSQQPCTQKDLHQNIKYVRKSTGKSVIVNKLFCFRVIIITIFTAYAPKINIFLKITMYSTNTATQNAIIDIFIFVLIIMR